MFGLDYFHKAPSESHIRLFFRVMMNKMNLMWKIMGYPILFLTGASPSMHLVMGTNTQDQFPV